MKLFPSHIEREREMHAAKKSTDSKCDSFRSITWILEVINGALVYGVVLLDRQNERKTGKEAKFWKESTFVTNRH